MKKIWEEFKLDMSVNFVPILLTSLAFSGIFIIGLQNVEHTDRFTDVKELPTAESKEEKTEEPELIVIEPVTEETVLMAEPEEEPEYRREVTDEEYQLLLRVCMSECGGRYGEPMEGKIAVVETILNRVDMEMGTIEQVVSDAYSTAYNGEPDETVIQAVEQVLTGENDFPDNMIAFRSGTYHSFGVPYKKIGNHYFSLVE